MPGRSLLRWPGTRVAGLVCLSIIVVFIGTFLLYSDQALPTAPSSLFNPESKNDPVISELVKITNESANTIKAALVLATTRSDDLTWLLEYCKESPGTIPFIYATDPQPDPQLLTPHTTRGREAAAYLSYIIDYYDRLPLYSIFIHSNQEQWHNDLFGPQTPATLHSLRLSAIDTLGYVNLRCQHIPGCPTSVYPFSPTAVDIERHDIRAYFPEAYQDIFGVSREEVPTEIGNVCCAQFAVSRERILQRPKEDYKRMLTWAAETNRTDSFGVGWVFEKIWHIIFGMPNIYCPRYEQCRCDAYGWCGPLAGSEETLQAVSFNSPPSI